MDIFMLFIVVVDEHEFDFDGRNEKKMKVLNEFELFELRNWSFSWINWKKSEKKLNCLSIKIKIKFQWRQGWFFLIPQIKSSLKFIMIIFFLRFCSIFCLISDFPTRFSIKIYYLFFANSWREFEVKYYKFLQIENWRIWEKWMNKINMRKLVAYFVVVFPPFLCVFKTHLNTFKTKKIANFLYMSTNPHIASSYD